MDKKKKNREEEEDRTHDHDEEEDDDQDASEDEDDESQDDEDQDDDSDDEEDDSDDEDIDYEGRLKELEGDKPRSKYTPLEKAQRDLHFNAKRVRELGGDPDEILGRKSKKNKKDRDEEDDEDDDEDELPSSSKFVTEEQLELREAWRDIKSRTSNEGERKLVYYYVENKGLDVDEAFILANKGKIKTFNSEKQRMNNGRPPQGNGEGSRKTVTVKIPKLKPEVVEQLSRRGLKYNEKTKRYEGKHTFYGFDPKSKKWVSGKL